MSLQWRAEANSSNSSSPGGPAAQAAKDDIVDHRNLKDADILNLAQV